MISILFVRISQFRITGYCSNLVMHGIILIVFYQLYISPFLKEKKFTFPQNLFYLLKNDFQVTFYGLIKIS